MEREANTAGDLVVPTSRASLIGIAAICGAFIVAGVCMLYVAGSTELGLVRMPQSVGFIVGAVGLCAVLFFGACGAYAALRIANPTPAVIVDRNGILDHASAIGVGFIAWSEIDELREYQFLGQAYLGIVPKNLESLITRLPAWKRVAIRANRLFGLTAVNIPQTMLEMSVPQLMREIDTRFRVRAVNMSGASEHPLDAELRDYLSHSDLRLMAEGKHAEFLQRARLRVRRSHYCTGLSVGVWVVMIVWVLSLYSRGPSELWAVIVVWALLAATMFAVKLWLWSRRRRALASALTRLERDVAERSQDGEASG